MLPSNWPISRGLLLFRVTMLTIRSSSFQTGGHTIRRELRRELCIPHVCLYTFYTLTLSPAKYVCSRSLTHRCIIALRVTVYLLAADVSSVTVVVAPTSSAGTLRRHHHRRTNIVRWYASSSPSSQTSLRRPIVSLWQETSRELDPGRRRIVCQTQGSNWPHCPTSSACTGDPLR